MNNLKPFFDFCRKLSRDGCILSLLSGYEFIEVMTCENPASRVIGICFDGKNIILYDGFFNKAVIPYELFNISNSLPNFYNCGIELFGSRIKLVGKVFNTLYIMSLIDKQKHE